MKKLVLITSLLFIGFNAFSQEKSDDNKLISKKNELKIDGLKIVLFPEINIEYEYFVNISSSAGGNIAFVFDSEHPYYRYYYDFFYRFYFAQKSGYGTDGFFTQPYLYYLNQKKKEEDIYSTDQNNKFSTTGIGFAVGKKWTNNYGISFQILAGYGRNFSYQSDKEKFLPKFDISIGYRF